MVHVVGDPGFFATHKENKAGTTLIPIQHPRAVVNHSGQTARAEASTGCSFVVADWRLGGEPFCGAPTRPGSSYCARHQPICIVARASAEGRSRMAALLAEIETAPEPPPELAHLRESVLPEALPDDIGDLRPFLDHAPPDPRTEESD